MIVATEAVVAVSPSRATSSSATRRVRIHVMGMGMGTACSLRYLMKIPRPSTSDRMAWVRLMSKMSRSMSKSKKRMI